MKFISVYVQSNLKDDEPCESDANELKKCDRGPGVTTTEQEQQFILCHTLQ